MRHCKCTANSSPFGVASHCHLDPPCPSSHGPSIKDVLGGSNTTPAVNAHVPSFATNLFAIPGMGVVSTNNQASNGPNGSFGTKSPFGSPLSNSNSSPFGVASHCRLDPPFPTSCFSSTRAPPIPSSGSNLFGQPSQPTFAAPGIGEVSTNNQASNGPNGSFGIKSSFGSPLSNCKSPVPHSVTMEALPDSSPSTSLSMGSNLFSTSPSSQFAGFGSPSTLVSTTTSSTPIFGPPRSSLFSDTGIASTSAASETANPTNNSRFGCGLILPETKWGDIRHPFAPLPNFDYTGTPLHCFLNFPSSKTSQPAQSAPSSTIKTSLPGVEKETAASVSKTQISPTEEQTSKPTTQVCPNCKHITLAGQPGVSGSRLAPYIESPDLEGTSKLCSISAMPVYQGKSHEELRREDYQLQANSSWNQESSFPGFAAFAKSHQSSSPSLFSSSQGALGGSNATPTINSYIPPFGTPCRIGISTNTQPAQGANFSFGGHFCKCQSSVAHSVTNAPNSSPSTSLSLGNNLFSSNTSSSFAPFSSSSALVSTTSSFPTLAPPSNSGITSTTQVGSFETANPTTNPTFGYGVILPKPAQSSPFPFGTSLHGVEKETTPSVFETLKSPIGKQTSTPIKEVCSNCGHTPFSGQLEVGGSRLAPYIQSREPDSHFGNGFLSSISAMPIYKEKSHEELRLEDYLLQGKTRERVDPFNESKTFAQPQLVLPVFVLPMMPTYNFGGFGTTPWAPALGSLAALSLSPTALLGAPFSNAPAFGPNFSAIPWALAFGQCFGAIPSVLPPGSSTSLPSSTNNGTVPAFSISPVTLLGVPFNNGPTFGRSFGGFSGIPSTQASGSSVSFDSLTNSGTIAAFPTLPATHLGAPSVPASGQGFGAIPSAQASGSSVGFDSSPSSGTLATFATPPALSFGQGFGAPSAPSFGQGFGAIPSAPASGSSASFGGFGTTQASRSSVGFDSSTSSGTTAAFGNNTAATKINGAPSRPASVQSFGAVSGI